MKDYYNLFVQLSLQQCTKNDYCDKQKVKAHNIASKNMQMLQDKMKQIDCIDLLNALLCHDDDRVKINAASLCVQMPILIETASLTLKNIIRTSNDSTISFAAKMIMKQIPENTGENTGDGSE